MFDITQLEDNKQKIQKDFAEISPIIASINVTDQDSLDLATKYAWEAQKRIKRIEDLRSQFKKPVLDFWKMIDTWAKNLSAPYEQAMNHLKWKMKTYHLEQDRIAKEAQDRLRKEQEDQRIAQSKKDQEEKDKMSEAQKSATPDQSQDLSAIDLIMGTAESTTPVAQAIEVKHDSKSKTESGSSFTRKTWKFELTDISQVPRDFLCLHDWRVREAIKDGTREIAGIRIYEDIDVSIRS
jgi:hypothetical protein